MTYIIISDIRIRKTTACVLCIMALSLAACLLAMPKKEFSENENRYLAQFPRLTSKTALSGEYTESLADWLADHFPMRDFFMGLKSSAEIMCGRREINHIYVAKDDYLIESYAKPQNTERIIDTLSAFYKKVKDKNADVSLMLVPTAVTICSDKLPNFAPLSNQIETARKIYDKTGIPAVDCTKKLLAAASESQVYYRTDHHWTTFGAYCGYAAYCEKKGIVPVPIDSLEANIATDEFAGTLYSKVNDYSHKKDKIVLYTNPADKLTVTYPDTGVATDSLYNMEYLAKKDKYSLFLDNVHPLVEIENSAADSENVLMLIKDSYANSIVPFLARHYKKIYVFDTRHYKKGPSSFLEEHSEVSDVLILYNMNTLDNDSGIRGIY